MAFTDGNFVVDNASPATSLLLFAVGSAPKFTNAPVAVELPVPPFATETTPVTLPALPVMLPEGVT